MIKDTDEQTDQEIHSKNSVRIPSTEPLFSWSWDTSASWNLDVFATLEAP